MKKDNSVKGKDLDNINGSTKVVGQILLKVDIVDSMNFKYKLPKYLAILCYIVKSQFDSKGFSFVYFCLELFYLKKNKKNKLCDEILRHFDIGQKPLFHTVPESRGGG